MLTFPSIAPGVLWLAARDRGSAAGAQGVTASAIGLLLGILLFSRVWTAVLHSVLAWGLVFGKNARQESAAQRSQLRRRS